MTFSGPWFFWKNRLHPSQHSPLYCWFPHQRLIWFLARDNRNLYIGGIAVGVVNALRGLLIITLFCLENIRNVLLRVAVDHRKPCALNLQHDSMPLQEAMVVSVNIDRNAGDLI